MSRAKVTRLQRVLRTEQRALDRLIQQLYGLDQKLNAIQQRLQHLHQQQQAIFSNDDWCNREPAFAISRVAWFDNLQNAAARLESDQAHLQRNIDVIRGEIQSQKARVSALELLMERLKMRQKIQLAQADLLDQGDRVLNQFLESEL